MERWNQAAMRNVQKYLGDLGLDPLNDADTFYEEVYTLAHDGAVDAGAPSDVACTIAQNISNQF